MARVETQCHISRYNVGRAVASVHRCRCRRFSAPLLVPSLQCTAAGAVASVHRCQHHSIITSARFAPSSCFIQTRIQQPFTYIGYINACGESGNVLQRHCRAHSTSNCLVVAVESLFTESKQKKENHRIKELSVFPASQLGLWATSVQIGRPAGRFKLLLAALIPLPTAPRQCGSVPQEFQCPLPPGSAPVHRRSF